MFRDYIQTVTPRAGMWRARQRVASFQDKSTALDCIAEHALQSGMPRSLRNRVRLVADELMMNALYHAPTNADGQPRYLGLTPREIIKQGSLESIEVHCGYDARYFAISVCDEFGSLTSERALEYLRRADRPESIIEEKAGGAGLGLISVLKSASWLILRLKPGQFTQAIALFAPRAPGSPRLPKKAVRPYAP